MIKNYTISSIVLTKCLKFFNFPSLTALKNFIIKELTEHSKLINVIYYALSLKSLSEVEDKSNAIQPGAKKILLILNQKLLAN